MHSIALHYIWRQCSVKIPQGGCHVPRIAGTRDRTHRTGKRVKGWRDCILYFTFWTRSRCVYILKIEIKIEIHGVGCKRRGRGVHCPVFNIYKNLLRPEGVLMSTKTIEHLQAG